MSYFQQMIRMTALMKKVYGEKEYNKKESVDWVDVSKKASFLGTPAQGPNECGFFVLKMAQFYHGSSFVVKFEKCNVILHIFPLPVCSSISFFLSVAVSFYLVAVF